MLQPFERTYCRWNMTRQSIVEQRHLRQVQASGEPPRVQYRVELFVTHVHHARQSTNSFRDLSLQLIVLKAKFLQTS